MDNFTYGREKLWRWFGLSRASYLVIPRVLAHEMPDAWQYKTAELLDEYDRQFPNIPDLGTRVLTTKNGRLVKTPEWLLNYRYPQWIEIEKLKQPRRKYK